VKTVAALVIAAACCVPGWSHARPLVLAFDELLPWKTYSNGEYGGAYTEIVRELARRTGQALEISNCPLKRCLFMLEHGSADIIIGLRETPERRRYLHFLRTPYRNRSSDKVFYVQEGRGNSIRDYADLATLRIGTKLGAEYLERFDRDGSLKKEPAKDMDINFRKLAIGRLDAVLIPEDQGEALLAQLRLDAQIDKAVYRIVDASPRAIAISRKSHAAAQLEAFESAMRDMTRDGTLAALYKRHYYDAWHVPTAAVQIK
jgi:polar amino acid transport system substrate-binding protein